MLDEKDRRVAEMRGDIETGYEAKFDFPPTEGRPEIAYLLATVPRTGSTYLSHVLWQTGCLGAPLEYLNFEPASPYAFAAGSPERQQQLWHSVVRSRTSPNGVFGLKGFQLQLQDLHRTNPPLLAAVLSTVLPPKRPKRVVYLGRRDRIAHVVSYARASMSGIWRKEQEQGESREIEYSQDMLDAAERGIDVQEARWEQMFRDLRIEPLRLWYEEVIARPADAARQVADYLGVSLDPSAAVQVPPILKQSEGGASAWIERYAQSRGAAPSGGE
jgi:LPS sulfotransferase NodH